MDIYASHRDRLQCWTDSRLSWTASSYGGISEIEVNFAWRPEFVIANSADTLQIIGSDNAQTRVRVYNTGLVRWDQALSTSTICDVNIARFPFDTQTCSIEVLFWGYTTSEIDLNTSETTIDTGDMKTNGEWTLLNTSFESNETSFCCPSSSSDVILLTFRFKRLTKYYVMNIILPSFLLSICSIWVFYLPTDSGERMGYALTILLAYTVQMSITAAMMPTTSKEVPLIAIYLLTVLILCTIVLSNLVMHVKLFYLEGYPPAWLQKVYRKTYPVVFFCRCCVGTKAEQLLEKMKINKNKVDVIMTDLPEKVDTDNVSESGFHGDQGNDEDLEEITWTQTAVWMDRMCFCFYLFLITSSNVTFIVMLTRDA